MNQRRILFGAAMYDSILTAKQARLGLWTSRCPIHRTRPWRLTGILYRGWWCLARLSADPDQPYLCNQHRQNNIWGSHEYLFQIRPAPDTKDYR